MRDTPKQHIAYRAAHEDIAAYCASAEFLVRTCVPPGAFGSIRPYAIREFWSDACGIGHGER